MLPAWAALPHDTIQATEVDVPSCKVAQMPLKLGAETEAGFC